MKTGRPFRTRVLPAALLDRAVRLLGRLPRNPLPLVFPNFHAWPKFRRHFARNLLIGALIETVVHLSGHTWHLAPVTGLENAALDAVMRLSADTASRSDGRPVQLFIDVDERTWRGPAWGGGEPKTVPLERVADLIARAARLNARFVLVDFLVEGPRDAEQEAFVARMEDIMRRSAESRFLFVRGFRRPLERAAAPGIRPAFAVDTLMARHPDRVFAVAPNFLLSGGQVLRHWRLWESACRPLPGHRGGRGEGLWAVTPSPQLMIAALEADSDIPWRLRFVEGPEGPTPVDPGPGGLCMTDASGDDDAEAPAVRERLRETGYSARLADHRAGRRVSGHFRVCYRQGFFSAADCARKAAPAPVSSREETAAPAGGHLANRVLFRRSDLTARHEAALRQGKTPDIKPYDPHFGRVAAAELLGEEPPRQGPTAAALKKFEEAGRQGKSTVAVIGASYDESRDFHMTPLGLMPGALVLVNAVDSLQTAGILQELRGLTSWAITIATLIGVSAAFALLSAFWATVFMCALTALTLGPLSLFFIKQGIWLNIAAPVIGIYLHHELETLMERREHRKHRGTSPHRQHHQHHRQEDV